MPPCPSLLPQRAPPSPSPPPAGDCPLGTFENSDGDCSPCGTGCAACTAPDACTACSGSRVLAGGACVSSCPSGQFANNATGACSACPASCSECDSPTQCLSCKGGFALFAGQCGACREARPDFRGLGLGGGPRRRSARPWVSRISLRGPDDPGWPRSCCDRAPAMPLRRDVGVPGRLLPRAQPGVCQVRRQLHLVLVRDHVLGLRRRQFPIQRLLMRGELPGVGLVPRRRNQRLRRELPGRPVCQQRHGSLRCLPLDVQRLLVARRVHGLRRPQRPAQRLLRRVAGRIGGAPGAGCVLLESAVAAPAKRRSRAIAAKPRPLPLVTRPRMQAARAPAAPLPAPAACAPTAPRTARPASRRPRAWLARRAPCCSAAPAVRTQDKGSQGTAASRAERRRHLAAPSCAPLGDAHALLRCHAPARSRPCMLTVARSPPSTSRSRLLPGRALCKRQHRRLLALPGELHRVHLRHKLHRLRQRD
jgi:hypothetical protein